MFKQLTEVDNLLNEKEMSLKKKIFSLSKMEALVFSDPKLTRVYDSMAAHGAEEYGYHYNETIMNILFNDYVLNSSRYLQKYKMAVPKKKKRRDKSGINKIRHDAASGKSIVPTTPTSVAETTSAGSAGGDAGYVGYSGPAAWSKSGKPMSRVLYHGGSIVEKTSDYLTESKMFESIIKELNEEFDRTSVINNINSKSNEFGTETKNMSNSNLNIINKDIKNGSYDVPDIGVSKVGTVQEKAVSKSQQRFMGMVHAVQNGDLDPSKVGDSVIKAADTMKSGDVVDFASTKTNKLPNKVDEYYDVPPQNPDVTPEVNAEKYREILTKLAKRSGTLEDVAKLMKLFLNKYEIYNTKEAIAVVRLASVIFKEEHKTVTENDDADLRQMQDDSTTQRGEAEKLLPMLNNIINNSTNKDELILGIKDFIRANNINDSELISHIADLAYTQFKNKGIDEGVAKPNAGIQRLVDGVNALIAQAIDPDGDPIPVVDRTSTWQEPYVYSPIIYKNGHLTITSRSIYKSEPEIETILSRNMQYDGIGTLKEIAKQYRYAIKNKDKYYAEISKNDDDLDDYGNSIREENSMIDSNPTSMKTSDPINAQSGGIERGMNSGSSMAEENNIENKTNDMRINEFSKELDIYTEQHKKLVDLVEDRKPSSLVLKDRLGNENASNFKKDLQHSGTKEIIDVEKELQYADQQTTVGDNPYKTGEEIEAKSTKKSLENVGDSTANGKDVPKRNFTDEEQDEVDLYRLGAGDYKFDNEVGEKYEERMKTDMGDDMYQKRQNRLKAQENMPMYNKDKQPVNDKDLGDSKFTKNLAESEEMVSGKYINELGKTKFVDFKLNECTIIESVDDTFRRINTDGMGNSYVNKLNTSTKSLDINEDVITSIKKFDFYIKEGKIYITNITKSMLSESVTGTKTSGGEYDKMKHLFGYKTNDFVNNKNNKRF